MSGESQPKQNGATIYGVMLAPDFARVVHRIADRENRLPSDVLLDLAIKGAECLRTHDQRPHHTKTK